MKKMKITLDFAEDAEIQELFRQQIKECLCGTLRGEISSSLDDAIKRVTAEQNLDARLETKLKTMITTVIDTAVNAARYNNNGPLVDLADERIAEWMRSKQCSELLDKRITAKIEERFDQLIEAAFDRKLNKVNFKIGLQKKTPAV